MEQDTFFKFISETHRAAFVERRKYEWKIILMILSFYVLSVAGNYGDRLNLLQASTIVKAVIWMVFLALAFVSSIYLSHIHEAHRTNKEFAETAERALIEKYGDDGLKNVQKSQLEPSKRNWSLRWQVAIIVAFAITSAFLLTYKYFP